MPREHDLRFCTVTPRGRQGRYRASTRRPRYLPKKSKVDEGSRCPVERPPVAIYYFGIKGGLHLSIKDNHVLRRVREVTIRPLNSINNEEWK